MTDSDKVIAATIKELNDEFGDNAVTLMDDAHAVNVEAIPTGCYSLDAVLGCGGLPRGRILEIFGQESSGKSTLALYIAAQVQKAGGTVAFVDAEYSFTKDYAEKMGIVCDKLILSQPSYGEEALKVVDSLAKSGEVDLIIVDSVAALVPKSEMEGEIIDPSMALQARMMSKALRMITATLGRTRTAVIFLNQVRDKIGVYYGANTTTSGGKALKFYASIRLEVKKLKKIEKGDEVIGNGLGICAVKNKVAPPFKTAELTIIYGEGIDVEADIFEGALAKGMVTKEGNTYSFNGVKLGVGREAAKEEFGRHEDFKQEVLNTLTKN